jgi:peptide chain release factor subunit 3
MDTSEEERARGKTVEVGRAHFNTLKKRYTLLDAPGHRNYVPNMIGGVSQADVGCLVISSRKGEFEAGFDRTGSTREHAILAKTLGLNRLIILINKMVRQTDRAGQSRQTGSGRGIREGGWVGVSLHGFSR